MTLSIPLALFMPLLFSSNEVSLFYDIYLVSSCEVNVGTLYVHSVKINATHINVTTYLSDIIKNRYIVKNAIFKIRNVTINELLKECKKYKTAILLKRPVIVDVAVCRKGYILDTVIYKRNIIYKEIIRYGGAWSVELVLKYVEVR